MGRIQTLGGGGGGGGTVTGTGVVDQVAFWSSATAIAGNVNFTFTGNQIQVGLSPILLSNWTIAGPVTGASMFGDGTLLKCFMGSWDVGGGSCFFGGLHTIGGTTIDLSASYVAVNGINGNLFIALWRGTADTFSAPQEWEFATGNNLFNTRVLSAIPGTAALPQYSFTLDPDTGLVNSAANSLAFSTGGVIRGTFNSSGNLVLTGTVLGAAGTAAIPEYSFSGDSNTGVFSNGADNLGFSTAGLLRFSVSAGGTLVMNGGNISMSAGTGVFLANSSGGTAAAPTMSWNGDGDTGMFRVAADSIGFSTGGISRFNIDSSGQINITSAATANLLWSTNESGNIGNGSNDPLNIFWSLADMKQIATPAAPAAGRNRLYWKSDDFLYGENSSGVEFRISPVPVVVSASGTVTLTASDNQKIYNLDVSGGVATVNLPSPTSGYSVYLKDSTGNAATNNITLVRFGAEKIEAIAASKVFQSNFGFWRIYTDGTDWFIG